MPTTAQQIIDNGFGLSRLSRPELQTPQAAALVRHVGRTLQALYAFAARVNPTFFAASEDVLFQTFGWIRPAAAENVFRIEALGATVPGMVVGKEILVVPMDDRAAFAGDPAVYRYGGQYFSAGNAGDPTSGRLRFFYSRRPTVPAALTDVLDSTWPENHNAILEYEIACFNARGDAGRDGELAVMIEERDSAIKLFEAFLEHETSNEHRRFGEIRWTATERRQPLTVLTQREG